MPENDRIQWKRRSASECEAEIADCDEILRQKPNNPYACYDRGIANYELRRYEEAIADFDKTIRLKPDLYTYPLRGMANYLLRRYQKAITDFDKAIRLDPNNTYL